MARASAIGFSTAILPLSGAWLGGDLDGGPIANRLAGACLGASVAGIFVWFRHPPRSDFGIQIWGLHGLSTAISLVLLMSAAASSDAIAMVGLTVVVCATAITLQSLLGIGAAVLLWRTQNRPLWGNIGLGFCAGYPAIVGGWAIFC